MPPDLLTLLRRDHVDLDRALVDLARPRLHRRELSDCLDGLRLGLIAHVEAEGMVFERAAAEVAPESPLHLILARTRAEHLEQERALSALVVSRPGTPHWRQRADQLRALIAEHARDEDMQLQVLQAELPPALFAALPGMFATERLVQLSMIQPSAPIASYAELAVQLAGVG